MSDDLGALANDLQTALWEPLSAAGWEGTVDVCVAPRFGALSVEIIPAGFPAPGVQAGHHLVPAEVWRDTAARPELVAHLTRTYLTP